MKKFFQTFPCFLLSFFFFVSSLTLFFSCQIHAQTHQQVLVTDPFQNRLLKWDPSARTLHDAFSSESLLDHLTLDLAEFSFSPMTPPLIWKRGEFVAFTQKGEIVLLSLNETGSAKVLYASEDQCRGDLAYGGCLYSMTLTEDGRILFIEHESNGTDTLKQLSWPAQVRTLVTEIPAPAGSGPLWIRPNGNVGILPFGQGIMEIKLPSPTAQPFRYGESLIHFTPLTTMASSVFEGASQLGVFDYSTFKLWTSPNSWRPLFKAASVANDPCSGQLWFLNAQGKLFPFSQGLIPTIGVQPLQCPFLVTWKILERSLTLPSTGPFPIKEKESLIQGWPSGRPEVPSEQVLSLGTHGRIILESSHWILDGMGTDLRIFENAFLNRADNSLFSEPAKVEIFDEEKDVWVTTGCDCQHPLATACAGMQPTYSWPGNGIRPWDQQAGGFPIDLNDYSLKKARKIRLTDCGNSFPDAPADIQGFDLDALIVTPNSRGNLVQ